MKNGLFMLSDMIGSPDVMGSPDGGRWFRAVPVPFYHGFVGRVRCSTAVLRGQAYAVRWPELGELEAAIAPQTNEAG